MTRPRPRRRHPIAATGAAVATLLVAACGTGANSGTPAPGSDTSGGSPLHRSLHCDARYSPEQLLGHSVPKAKKRFRVTVMEASLAGYFYQAVAYGAEKAAREAGVDLRIVAGNGFTTPGPQLSQAEQVIQRGTDAIALMPVDTKGSVPIVARAKAAHIPLIDFGTEVDSQDVTASVLQDDYLIGKIGADQLARVVPSGGPGIVMAGPATATWSKKRIAGFMDQLHAKYPKFTVAAAPTGPVDPAAGLKDFTDATQTHPDIKWVYSVFYYQLLPDSLTGRFHGIPFVTTGYEPTAVKSLQNGTLAATIPVDNVWMGYMAVVQAVRSLNGETVPKTTCLPVSQFNKSDIGTAQANAELYPASFTASSG
ncbi:sugar ABC transporter substrate-binding protein [Wenjunlia tyrosinilytica]|nr:sugar ABC transporter substrate-binding protein [Wenjunlia tyrosinilytica]